MRSWLILAAIPLLSTLSAANAMAQLGCKTVTLTEVANQSREEMIKPGMGALADGVVLIGESKGNRLVLLGTAIYLLRDLLDVSKGASTAIQIHGLQGVNPNSPLRLCPAASSLAASLGFQRLSVIGPAALAPIVAKGNPAPDNQPAGSILQQIHGFQKLALPLNLLPKIGTVQPPAAQPWRQPMARPFDPGPLLKSRPATVKGRVFDRDLGYPLSGALVRVTGVSVGFRDAWQGAFTRSDGTFEFANLLPGDYLLFIDQPGHYGYTRSISVGSGETARFDVALPVASPYPCQFSVINRTGWNVGLSSTDEIPPGEMLPFASVAFIISSPTSLYAHANFEYGPPVLWGPMTVQCGGPNSINIIFNFSAR